MEQNITALMISAANDIDQLSVAMEIAPTTPENFDTGLDLVQKALSVGKKFREFGLALLARANIDSTYKDSYKVVATCQICGYVYDDIETEPMPLRCNECKCYFQEAPPRKNRVQRFPTWDAVESVVLERMDVSRGTLTSRIALYRKMMEVGMSWQGAYSAMLKSPVYCEKLLEAFNWDHRGRLVDVPEDTILPEEIREAPKEKALALTKQFIADKIEAETAVMEDGDKFVKTELIKSAALMSGKPVTTVYEGRPGSNELVFVMTKNTGHDVAIETILRFASAEKELSRDDWQRICKVVGAKNPPRDIRREIW